MLFSHVYKINNYQNIPLICCRYQVEVVTLVVQGISIYAHKNITI